MSSNESSNQDPIPPPTGRLPFSVGLFTLLMKREWNLPNHSLFLYLKNGVGFKGKEIKFKVHQ